MATGRTGSSSVSTTGTKMLDSAAYNRKVRVHVEGNAKVRLGFTSSEVNDPDAGFLIASEFEFILAAGDELWRVANYVQPGAKLNHMVTLACCDQEIPE